MRGCMGVVVWPYMGRRGSNRARTVFPRRALPSQDALFFAWCMAVVLADATLYIALETVLGFLNPTPTAAIAGRAALPARRIVPSPAADLASAGLAIGRETAMGGYAPVGRRRSWDHMRLLVVVVVAGLGRAAAAPSLTCEEFTQAACEGPPEFSFDLATDTCYSKAEVRTLTDPRVPPHIIKP